MDVRVLLDDLRRDKDGGDAIHGPLDDAAARGLAARPKRVVPQRLDRRRLHAVEPEPSTGRVCQRLHGPTLADAAPFVAVPIRRKNGERHDDRRRDQRDRDPLPRDAAVEHASRVCVWVPETRAPLLWGARARTEGEE